MLALETPPHRTNSESCRRRNNRRELLCHRPLGYFGQITWQPFSSDAWLCVAGGAAAEKRVTGPESRATCRRARHETLVPSAVRGLPVGARWRAPPFSGVTGGTRRCPTPSRGRTTSGQRVWRSGGNLASRAPSSPVGRLGHVGKEGRWVAACDPSPARSPLLLSLGGNLQAASQ